MSLTKLEEIAENHHAAYLTIEEVAQALSVEDGRHVSIQEVRQIETRAMRKLRQVLQRRKLTASDLLLAE
jgi:DNA-directed RNA polymerase sigma subunit (sigma70/sigma32)